MLHQAHFDTKGGKPTFAAAPENVPFGSSTRGTEKYAEIINRTRYRPKAFLGDPSWLETNKARANASIAPDDPGDGRSAKGGDDPAEDGENPLEPPQVPAPWAAFGRGRPCAGLADVDDRDHHINRISPPSFGFVDPLLGKLYSQMFSLMKQFEPMQPSQPSSLMD